MTIGVVARVVVGTDVSTRDDESFDVIESSKLDAVACTAALVDGSVFVIVCNC